MTFRIALALFCISTLSLDAQKNEAYKSSSRISDFSVQFGMNSLSLQPSPVEDFKRIVPQSQLLTADYENYNSNQQPSFASNSFMSILLGIELANKKTKQIRTKPKLRLGFNYGSFSTLSGYLQQTERFVYDTLVSAQFGNVYFADSVVNRSLVMDQSTQQLSMDLALLYRTNTENRISLYTGIGIGAGISMNANTYIRYHKRSTSEVNGSSDSDFIGGNYSEESNLKTESFKSKNPSSFWVYIPIGIDFRISKYSELLKHTYLFVETRPAITRTSIPDFASTTQGSLAFTAGMRYNF